MTTKVEQRGYATDLIGNTKRTNNSKQAREWELITRLAHINVLIEQARELIGVLPNKSEDTTGIAYPSLETHASRLGEIIDLIDEKSRS